MDIHIKQIDAMPVASVRGLGAYPETLPRSWEKLMSYVLRKGLCKPGSKMLSAFHDNPTTTPPQQQRSDACITVSEDFLAEDDIQTQTIPGGKFAVTLHKGPYANLGQAWGAFADELARRGLATAPRLCFEVYLNDPRGTPADELLTELWEPLA